MLLSMARDFVDVVKDLVMESNIFTVPEIRVWTSLMYHYHTSHIVGNICTHLTLLAIANFLYKLVVLNILTLKLDEFHSFHTFCVKRMYNFAQLIHVNEFSLFQFACFLTAK